MQNKILLSSGSLYTYGLNRFFKIAKQAKFDGIELVIDERWDSRQPEYIRELEKEFGIKVYAAHSAMEFVRSLGDAKKRIDESIDIAKKLKLKVLVVHSWDYDDEGFIDWAFKNRKSIYKKAEPVKIAFENGTKSFSPYISGKLMSVAFKYEKFSRFENINLDSSHLATAKMDIVKTAEKLGSKIKHLHLSDSDFDLRTDRPNSIDDRHMIPGRGKLPLDKYLKTLKKQGYSGMISVELDPKNIGAGKSDEVVLKNLIEARNFVKKNFK